MAGEVSTFFESFGFFTPTEFARTHFIQHTQREGVRVFLWQENIGRLILDLPILSAIAGVTRLIGLKMLWNQPEQIATQEAQNWTTFRVGQIVRSILEILQICLIADLLVTLGRGIHSLCSSFRNNPANLIRGSH